MMIMLREIKEFFAKERAYLFVLLALVVIFILLLLRSVMVVSEDRTVAQTIPVESHQTNLSPSAEEIQERLAGDPELSFAFELFFYFFSFALVTGFFLMIYDVWRWAAKGEDFIPSASTEVTIRWGIAEVFKVIILFVAFNFLADLFLLMLMKIFFSKMSEKAFFLFPTLASNVVGIFIIVWVVRVKGSNVRDLFGFELSNIVPERMKEFLKEIWLGIRTYLAILPIMIASLAVLVTIATLFAYEPPVHPLVDVFLEEKQAAAWLVPFSILLACIIGPIGEEIFFRGFLYPALRKYWGIWQATCATALLFAVVHANAFALLPIFLLGVVLARLYEKRRSLTSCITLHVFHNTAFIGYFFLVKNILMIEGGLG